MSRILPLLYGMFEEGDEKRFQSLPSDKKFFLIVNLIKGGVIKNSADFMQSLTLLGWEYKDFLDALEDLWDKKKIGFEEIDILDKHPVVFKGPGFISDRTLDMRIGRDQICKRIPPKYHDDLPLCKGFSS